MDFTEIKVSAREVLSESRYEHTIRVMDTAIALARHYDVTIEKTKIAAILHDYAKCFSLETLKELLDSYHLASELLQYHHELWHGPVAAELVRERFDIIDKDILNAIRYHTTGRVGMTKLEYIIFVADYIEPARSFEGIEDVRMLAKVDLESATRKALQYTIMHLMNMDLTIHPDSYTAYNYLTEKIKGR